MDIMTILHQELLLYAKNPVNGVSLLTINQEENTFAVITIAKMQNRRFAEADIIVRCDADMIVIELDIHDKPLVDALVQAGIPRDKIILAYAGETVPEAADFGSVMPQPEEPMTA
jgi:hypothetical protein